MIRPRRQARAILTALLACGSLLGLCAAGSPQTGIGHAYFPLDSASVAIAAGGQLARVDHAADLVPGTRVVAGTADSDRQAAEQRAWLAAGTVPQIAELAPSSMLRDALLDLHVLSHPSGVAVAGWAPAWRHVWPRDSALVATALARTGHLRDAEFVLAFLQRVQPESGMFDARYAADGSGVSDGRGSQTDSIGWALWALDQVTAELPAADRSAFVERHRRLLKRSAVAASALVNNPRSLPPASPDYWERRERTLTLSTAALVHTGLIAAERLYRVLGEEETAGQLSEAAARTAAAITRSFAADGYPRSLGGGASSVDLGVSYLLPPFAESVDPRTLEVWRGSAAHMARPAGGLAPGGSWRPDGVSWNTATSSHAMTAAFVGDRASAVRELRWLDAHRTRLGSLPEKVLDDGRPASVAPLAWAAAATIIAADELQDRGQ